MSVKQCQGGETPCLILTVGKRQWERERHGRYMDATAGLARESFTISLYAALVARITPLVCVSIIASLILFSSHRYIAKVPPNGNPTKQGQMLNHHDHNIFIFLFIFDR